MNSNTVAEPELTVTNRGIRPADLPDGKREKFINSVTEWVTMRYGKPLWVSASASIVAALPATEATLRLSSSPLVIRIAGDPVGMERIRIVCESGGLWQKVITTVPSPWGSAVIMECVHGDVLTTLSHWQAAFTSLAELHMTGPAPVGLGEANYDWLRAEGYLADNDKYGFSHAWGQHYEEVTAALNIIDLQKKRWIHGSAHAGNMLVNELSGTVRFVDAERSGNGPAAVDVANLCASALLVNHDLPSDPLRLFLNQWEEHGGTIKELGSFPVFAAIIWAAVVISAWWPSRLGNANGAKWIRNVGETDVDRFYVTGMNIALAGPNIIREQLQ